MFSLFNCCFFQLSLESMFIHLSSRSVRFAKYMRARTHTSALMQSCNLYSQSFISFWNTFPKSETWHIGTPTQTNTLYSPEGWAISSLQTVFWMKKQKLYFSSCRQDANKRHEEKKNDVFHLLTTTWAVSVCVLSHYNVEWKNCSKKFKI